MQLQRHKSAVGQRNAITPCEHEKLQHSSVGLAATMMSLLFLFTAVDRTQAGTVYDANADFNASLAGPTNPNGVWTYAWSENLLGTLTAFPNLDDPAPVNCSAEAIWFDPAINFMYTPSVAKSVYGSCGNPAFLQNELVLHGGGSSMPTNKYAHVVFTAPQSATYGVNASFISREISSVIDADVHVVINGVSVFDAVMSFVPLGTLESYSNPGVQLDAGDTVSFVVGPNGTLGPGNVAVEATMTVLPPIPTVSEWGLILMSLFLFTAGTLVLRWRRSLAA